MTQYDYWLRKVSKDFPEVTYVADDRVDPEEIALVNLLPLAPLATRP